MRRFSLRWRVCHSFANLQLADKLPADDEPVAIACKIQASTTNVGGARGALETDSRQNLEMSDLRLEMSAAFSEGHYYGL